MKKGMIFTVLFFLGATAVSFGDVVYLKNGKVYKGEVVSDTKYSVKLKVDGLPKVFYADQIDRVEYEQEVEVAPANVRKLEAQEVTDQKRELVLRFLAANGALDGIRQSLSVLLGNVPSEMREKFQRHLTAQGFADQFVPVYAKYFTEEELKELIRFYSSSAGKRVVEVAPILMEESLAAAVVYFKALDKEEESQP